MALLTIFQFLRFNVPEELQGRVLPSIPFGFLFGIFFSILLETIFHNGWKGLLLFKFSKTISFFGWLLGVLLFLKIYAALRNISFSFLLNLFLPSVALAQGFGRIGCFLGGCCWGLPVSKPWGFVYPEGSLPYEMYGSVPIFPIQLLEAIFLFSVSAILFLRVRFCNRASWYFILVGAGRFFLEIFRGDSRGDVFLGCPFSPAQCIGLMLVAFGLTRLFSSKCILTAKSENI